jgi:hypothetical protein
MPLDCRPLVPWRSAFPVPERCLLGLIRRAIRLVGVMGLAGVFCAQTTTTRESYLSWNADRAEKEAKAMRAEGRVAGQGGIRIRSIDPSSSYKIRATWLTPDVIRGTARLLQISERIASSDATALVSEAEAAGHTVIPVEIDRVPVLGLLTTMEHYLTGITPTPTHSTLKSADHSLRLDEFTEAVRRVANSVLLHHLAVVVVTAGFRRFTSCHRYERKTVRRHRDAIPISGSHSAITLIDQTRCDEILDSPIPCRR